MGADTVFAAPQRGFHGVHLSLSAVRGHQRSSPRPHCQVHPSVCSGAGLPGSARSLCCGPEPARLRSPEATPPSVPATRQPAAPVGFRPSGEGPKGGKPALGAAPRRPSRHSPDVKTAPGGAQLTAEKLSQAHSWRRGRRVPAGVDVRPRWPAANRLRRRVRPQAREHPAVTRSVSQM